MKLKTPLIVAIGLLVLGFFALADEPFPRLTAYLQCKGINTPSDFAAARSRSYDAKRIAELKSMAMAIELYRDARGYNPVVFEGNDIERWKKLGDILLREKLIVNLPEDPCKKHNANYDYTYKSSPDGREYVLKAHLLRPWDLADDLDGNVLGISCGEGENDREYCRS